MCSRRCITDRTAALRGLVSTVSDGAVCYLIRLHFDRTSMFPEFRKHGSVYPSIYSELTAEAILTNRDSAARTPRTSFGVSADTDYVCHRCHSARPQLNVKR